ncbi:type VII secretion integral membrane protein EccD [Streptomyces mexicanus]|uniref:type VII secretion integral membrane protein EccD n=1 Tax=Streptomyces mexicanus TaxID=178566 RepID=UPI00135865B8|nr:type VII secretion integral membrane protein EccD [Streptomyces mexicanus]
MTDSAVADLCRLTVRAPAVSIDLAVPSDVPVADLLPTLLRYVGENAEEAGLEHAGWVLQRLGDAPLDEDATLAQAGLTDGSVLHLRPHTEALPEARLDDLVDGIADTARRRLHNWTPDAARASLVSAAAAVVLGALVMLFWPGTPGMSRPVCAGVAGMLLLVGAGSASRAMGDRISAQGLGLLVAPCLALAAWVLPGGEVTGPDATRVVGARLLAAGAAGAGGAVLALAATGLGAPSLLATAVVSVAAALAGALMAYSGLDAQGAAAVVGAAVALSAGFVPALAFKLAGMRMPALPSDARQLQEDIEPYHSEEGAARTELAGRWITALFAATAVSVAAALVPLTHRPGTAQALTAGALTALLLLHARGLVHVGQRLALASAAVWGLLLLARAWAVGSAPGTRPVVFGALLALAAVLTLAAWVVPGRRMLPYWGRAAEILHTAVAVAVLPLTLWVAGLFGWLRGLFG